ncbi:MAG: diacylglycerol kinase family protein [Bacteroidaceae bacterium]|nr:diacylglycerol kinase family protein [Bacteroidaceae bacterium]
MIDRDRKHKFSLRERFGSFVYAGRGLKLLFHEHNTWIHLVATLCVAIVGWWVSLSTIEWAIAIILVGGVWVTEALNTAIERLCDHVTPEMHPEIGHIKDIAAATVLLSAAIAVMAGLCIFVPAIIDKVNQLL